MKWNVFTRIVFFAVMLVLGLVLAWGAVNLCDVFTRYDWLSTNDQDRWKDWNQTVYWICSAFSWTVFTVCMWYHRSGIGTFEQRKNIRASAAVISSVIMFILMGGAAVLVCAKWNPNIKQLVVIPHFAFMLIPLFFMCLLFCFLVINGKKGIFNW